MLCFAIINVKYQLHSPIISYRKCAMTPTTRRKKRKQSSQDSNARRVVLPITVVSDLVDIGALTGHTEMKDTIAMLCKR